MFYLRKTILETPYSEQEMDTPITVTSSSTEPNKSDFLQLNYSPTKHEETVISIDSTSYERVPVSWDAKNINFARTDSNTTLTNIQKVSNWIKSIEGETREVKSDSVGTELDKSLLSESSKSDLMESIKKDDGTESKSVIMFRCDFNKSVSAKTYYPPLNPFNRATPLINYFKNENKEKLSSSLKNSDDTNEAASHDSLKNTDKKSINKKHLVLKRPNSGKLFNYPSQINSTFSIENKNQSHLKMSDEKSEEGSDVYEVPLSPESRKKELCSYLQLMNPADKKERFILQNRRSTRVRNLAAMQEKKELERKIKQSELDDSDQPPDKEVEKCATLKSFKELNIRVEKVKFTKEFYDKMKRTEFERDTFCFPFPSRSLSEQINDFDSTMAKLVPRYKRICKLKNIKLNSKVKLKKTVPKNKENLVRNAIKNKHKDVPKNIKMKKINNMKNNLASSKNHRLKDVLRSKYKKPLNTERSKSLRSTAKRKNISIKKMAKNENGQEDKEKKNMEKKKLQKNQQISKLELNVTKTISTTINSRTNSKQKSASSQCEIVTMAEKSDNHIDLENFMDDMIDFNNLSEEHKKCLIESRILSTKPMTQVSFTGCTEEDRSQSFYSLHAISPLYGFRKSDMSEVKKICEAYKNSSLLKNCTVEVMQDCFFDADSVKVEDNEVSENMQYKTETETAKSYVEKLASPVIEDVMDQDFTDDLEDSKFSVESVQHETNQSSSPHKEDLTNGISLQEHDYAGMPSEDDDEDGEEVDVVTVPNKNLPVGGYIQVNPRKIIKTNKYQLLPYNKSVEIKSLHRSLQYLKKKTQNGLTDHTFTREWDPDSSPKQKSKKQSHYISINKENGSVLKAFYIDYNLIVCQEYVVSFWMQTPLGNVLGSQNMWIPRGETQRLVLNNKCVQKESMEMVIAMDTHVAYIELWTKEHKSDIREGPVADVFATVYFWKQGQSGLERKVLQLENINGFADDVQYSVMKCAPKIIVSWHSANEDNVTRRTFIHAYQLAPDYQTVANIYDIEPVDHYVSSLHNIEDCENLIMGCGENKITLWNVEYGYIVATVELTEIKSPLCTLWVKCDRGFLFALQQCVDRELRLIAINGINHSWKKLASYIPSEGFDRLRGVCIENGLLLSFYDQGILCWKAETGEPVEETNVETEIIPSGKYVILLEDNRILVKHAITHLMSASVEDT